MMLYISGPITGNPDYLEQFAAAELELATRGYDVYNPAAHVLEKKDALVLPAAPGYEGTPSWSDYMRRDILVIARDADGLALLPGWADSEGAVLEVQVAKAFGLPIRTIPGWIQHDKENNPFPINEASFGIPARLRDAPPPGPLPQPAKLCEPEPEAPAKEVFTHRNAHLFKDFPVTDAEPDGQELVQAILDRKAARELTGFDSITAADADRIPEPVAITESEFLGNDGLGNPAGSPADHTTTDNVDSECVLPQGHFWVTSETRDGLIRECPNCGETTIERPR